MAHTFLVTGATGHQGGHTARLLLAADQKVHLLVRDPTAPKAIKLKRLGAEVFTGDFSSPDSIFSAAQGCAGVFIIVSPVLTDPLGERTHIQNILSACWKARVRKIVQSSVVRPEKPEKEAFIDFDERSWMANYFASKRACEAVVREAEGFESWTILRPSRLLSSYVASLTDFMFPTLQASGVIRTAIDKELKQQVLDPMDVGRIAVRAFLDKDGVFEKRTVGLAAKEMTMDDIVGAMNAALKEERVKIEYMGEQEIREAERENPVVGLEMFLNKNLGQIHLNLGQTRELGIEEVSVKEF